LHSCLSMHLFKRISIGFEHSAQLLSPRMVDISFVGIL
jgi:hypothetical protein